MNYDYLKKKKINFSILANSHLWSVSEFLFDFLGKKLEPEFGQNFRHDHKWPVLTRRNKLETNLFVFK